MLMIDNDCNNNDCNTVASLHFAWRNWLGNFSSKVWNMVSAVLCGLFGGNAILILLKTLRDL